MRRGVRRGEEEEVRIQDEEGRDERYRRREDTTEGNLHEPRIFQPWPRLRATVRAVLGRGPVWDGSTRSARTASDVQSSTSSHNSQRNEKKNCLNRIGF